MAKALSPQLAISNEASDRYNGEYQKGVEFTNAYDILSDMDNYDINFKVRGYDFDDYNEKAIAEFNQFVSGGGVS